MRTSHRMRRTMAAVLLMTYLPACYHYVTPKEMTPAQYIAAKDPKQVRVTLADSSQVVLRDPWVSADSLGGRLMVQDARARDPGWATPLSQVRRLEGHEYDNWGVAGITVGTLVVVGGTMFVAAMIALSKQ